jgi:hypothetical protein
VLPAAREELVVCEVDFHYGMFAGIPLEQLEGVLHEKVEHCVSLFPDSRVLSVAKQTQFCERIVYDWRVSPAPEDSPGASDAAGGTLVDLQFEIVFRSLVHVPAWDLFAGGMIPRVVDAFVQRIADRPVVVAPPQPAALPAPESAAPVGGGLGGVDDRDRTYAPPPPSIQDPLLSASTWLLNTAAAATGVPLQVVSVRPDQRRCREVPARSSSTGLSPQQPPSAVGLRILQGVLWQISGGSVGRPRAVLIQVSR